METEDLSAEKAFVLRHLRSYFKRLPRAMRTGVAQPGGKPNKWFPMTVPRDMWDGQPDDQGLVAWKPVRGDYSMYDWLWLPEAAPPIYQAYLFFWRGCGLPLRVRDWEIWLETTPTHLPGFATDRIRQKHGDFLRFTGYYVFANTHNHERVVCFDFRSRDASGDYPVVLLPTAVVDRHVDAYRREVVEPRAELLAPTFRDFLTEACSKVNATWPSNVASPFARAPVPMAELPPFDWAPYLKPARRWRKEPDIGEVDRHCERIKAKLDALRQADPGCLVAGAMWHRHRMNPPIRAEELARFEEQEKASIPVVYARFLLKVGNGGIGPHEWLYHLQVSSASWLRDALGWVDAEDGRLGQPFPHRSPFNPPLKIEEDPFEMDYREHDHPRHVQGSLILTQLTVRRYVCQLLLIVTGPERGNLWIDDRTRGRGIYPLRQQGPYSFFAWYEQGLDFLLKRLDHLYDGVADRPVEEFNSLADDAFGLTHLSAPREE